MHVDSPGAGLFFGGNLAPYTSSKSWKISDILAAMAKEEIPANKRIYWDVIIRPHNTSSPDTTDRTETSFGFGPAATPTPLVVSANPGLTLKPTPTPVRVRAADLPVLPPSPTPTPGRRP